MNITRQLLAPMLVLTAFGAQAEPLEFPRDVPACAPKSHFSVIDISMPVQNLFETNGHKPVLKVLKDDFKIETIFRYYDDPENPTLQGKPLRSKESDALLAAGFKIGVVFQHHNDDPNKFRQPGVGKADAKTALNLADENKQPYGSAIYFGVDGPFESPGLRRNVRQYFQDIESEFKDYATRHGGNRYDIGMYCSADMCSVGDDLKLKYMWLSPAGRNSDEYKKRFNKPDRLNLVQSRESEKCKWTGAPDGQSATIDFDQINSDHPNLGTWDHKRQ